MAPPELNAGLNPYDVPVRLPPVVATPPHEAAQSIVNCGGSAGRRKPTPPTADGYMNMM